MAMYMGYNSSGDKDYPDINTTKDDEYPGGLTAETHDDLLSYLTCRLDEGSRMRPTRLQRYAQIDRTTSTWQKLTPSDTERKVKQEETGQAQAVNMNLPLVHTHLEDMVAFFAAIYSPTQGDFLSVPDENLVAQEKELLEKLNVDSKRCKYFKNLCATLRAVMKYNIAGFHLEWRVGNPEQQEDAYNCMTALDMYNFLWDPTVIDPAEIACNAEYAAMCSKVNRTQLLKGDGDEYIGISGVIDLQTNGNIATYYRDPPIHAGLSYEDDKTMRNGAQADWNAYGASLASDGVVNLGDAYELVTMYCWVEPSTWKLEGITVTDDYVKKLVLYQFKILDGERIVAVERVLVGGKLDATEIPIYAGYLNQDDMKDAQRSQAELLAPFQNYASFLVNADVAGTRGAIWGIQVYDPNMFNMASLPGGAVSGRIPSTQPGRDVRTGLLSVNGEYDTSQTLSKLQAVMQMLQQFFPSQALPSQVAGIDRAIQSQVAAVMQGVSRRLHMLVRVLDDDIMNPMRIAAYKNIVQSGVLVLDNMTDAKARKILGSGIQQLNREAAAEAMQQLLFALIQNPQSANQIDILGLMNFWANLLAMPIDLAAFKITQPQQQVVPPAQGVTDSTAPSTAATGIQPGPIGAS